MNENLKEHYRNQINSIIEFYNNALNSEEGKNIINELMFGKSIKPLHAQRIISRTMNAILRISGESSAYHQEALEIKRKYPGADETSLDTQSRLLVTLLLGLGEDIDGGWLQNSSELVRSDIFSNYLDMADHLLSEGYKNAAAVITGSSLEVHLRELANKHSIELEYINHQGVHIQKKSNTLNSDIKKEGVYNEMQRTQIETWLKLRNNAAHGQYDEYDNSDVTRFLVGIRDFILKYPA